MAFFKAFFGTLPLIRNTSQEKLYEETVCKTYVAQNSMKDVIAVSNAEKNWL